MNPKTEQRVDADERPIRSCNGFVLANPAYHCKAIDLWPTEIREAKEEWIREMDRYLHDFCRPVRTIADELRCIACDDQITDHHIRLQGKHARNLTYSPEGTMEGRCNRCGYPARLKHEIWMPDKQTLVVRLTGFPLFYHPDSTARADN